MSFIAPEGDDVPPARLHSLDALRAVALLAGVVLHAVIPYMVAPMPTLLWSVHERTRHAAFDVLFWVLRGWHLPVFFLLSGFFAAGFYQSRGARAFLAHRTRRILGPFVVGCVFLLPLTYFAWAQGWVLSGRATMHDILSIDLDASIQHRLWGPAHLWFLSYLYLLSVALWAFWRVRGPAAASVFTQKRPLQRGWATRLSGIPASPFILAVPSVAILWLRPDVITDFDNTFVPDLAILAYYALFMAAGVRLHRFRGNLKEALGPASTYLFGSALLYAVEIALRLRFPGGAGGAEVRAALAMTTALAAWLSVFGLLGLFVKHVQQPGSITRYLADASYWVYLLHVPVVGLFHALLFPLDLSIPAKFLIALVATMAVTLLSYQMFIRNSWLGAQLGGPRRGH